MGFFSPTDIQNEDIVRLRPFAGLKPAVWVSGLFGLMAAAVVFFLMFFPALVKPGSLVNFRSEPLGAAVSVDGVYRGKTPFAGFVARGDRVIEMEMAGFTRESARLHIKSGLFATLFFPRRETVELTMTEEKPNAALLHGAREFAAWSFTGEPTEFYQIPLVLSDGAYRSGAGGNPDEAREILKAATRFAQTRAGVRDLARAYFLTAEGGGAPSGISAVDTARDMLTWFSENPEASSWLAGMLTGNARETLLASAWYAASQTALNENDAPSAASSAAGAAVTIEGAAFVPIADGLYAAREPVTDSQFAAFTADQPEWGRGNAAALAENALVTEDYLVAVEDERYPFPAVSGVSYYAAESYCRWLTTRLPESLSGWTVTLPSEEEWETVSRSSRIAGIGSIWEWCRTPYAPFPFFNAKPLYIEETGSPLKTVRGGNWIRARGAAGRGAGSSLERGADSSSVRGSVSPRSSTPFVTFRPVLVKNG